MVSMEGVGPGETGWAEPGSTGAAGEGGAWGRGRKAIGRLSCCPCWAGDLASGSSEALWASVKMRRWEGLGAGEVEGGRHLCRKCGWSRRLQPSGSEGG